MAAETGGPHLDDLYEYAACGLLVTDAAGTIRVVNDTFCQWTGHRREDLIGRRKLQDLLTMGGRIFHQTHWAPLLQIQGSVAEVKLDLIHANGEVKPMILNAVSRLTGDVVRHEIAAFGAADRHRYERELLLARRRAEDLHTKSMETQRALVATQAELDLQKQAAEDRASFAEQMVGIVSHDLRNPLSAIKMSALLLGRGPLDAKQRAVLGRIVGSVDRARRLVSDLLDFALARVGHGLPLTLAPIDLQRVVAAAVDELAVVFEGRALLHEHAGEGACLADAQRLTQLVGNLVTNAMSHGAAGGTVRVKSRIEATGASISVHNEGPAIASALLERIFDPMTRGAAGDGGQRSVGLGLYIVRQIARAHSGEVHVASTPGDGTTFTLTMPRRPPPAEAGDRPAEPAAHRRE